MLTKWEISVKPVSPISISKEHRFLVANIFNSMNVSGQLRMLYLCRSRCVSFIEWVRKILLVVLKGKIIAFLSVVQYDNHFRITLFWKQKMVNERFVSMNCVKKLLYINDLVFIWENGNLEDMIHMKIMIKNLRSWNLLSILFRMWFVHF